MPTSTFLNLPQQKREKLLDAARAEFARVPYTDASINQIIQAAGIPRGSFYMYFKDKAELFAYLVCEYSRYIGDFLSQQLRENQGDLFATLLAVFDFAQQTSHDPCVRQIYENVFQIISINGSSAIGAFMEQAAPAILSAFTQGVDRNRLDLRGDTDFEDLIFAIMAAMGHFFHDVLIRPEDPTVRVRYENTLRILARGMSSTS